MEFRWIPHRGLDLDAVERMKQHFPKPAKAARIAWFMSEVQEYHTELLEMPSLEVETHHLTDYLHDTGGGIKNFGRYEEWVIWFLYLFPFLLTRILEEDLLTLTINYFMNLYPGGFIEEYPGFRVDVLQTLPQSIMKAELWDGQDLSKSHFWYDVWEGNWTCPLYATMFFCLKYLTTDEIPSWVASIAEIEGSLWRKQIHKWLAGAKKLFRYVEHPEELPDTNAAKRYPEKGSMVAYLEVADIYWSDAYLVFSDVNSGQNVWDYISKENVEAFWNEVKKYPQLSFSDAT